MSKKGSTILSKKLYKLTIGGGVAFWAANFAISRTPIAAEYRGALSISYYPMLLAATVGGLMIGFCVSYFLLRFFDWIPGRHPIFKAWILSFSVMVFIEVLSALGDPSHTSIYLLLDTGMNAPRFLALGLAIGDLFDKKKGKV